MTTMGPHWTPADLPGEDARGRQILIEVCVEGIDGLLAAEAGGADRVELCASLIEGGLTPSIGTVREALVRARIPFNVIVRPRGGDFLYTDAEFASMLDDVRILRDLGVNGVVIGCLTPDGRVDEQRTGLLVAEARPLSVTFHRAFDMTRDPDEALGALIRCNVDRVLTSGQCPDALSGLGTLARLNQRTRSRIIVMGCGDLSLDNIVQVARGTGLHELHFAAPQTAPSRMIYRNAYVGMGGTELDREYTHTVTDTDMVRRMIEAVRSA